LDAYRSAFAEAMADRSGADGSERRSPARLRLVPALVLALLVVPSAAVAQRDPFFSALVQFHRSSAGLYGDEGPQLTAHLEAMSTALARWDAEIRNAERELRSRLAAADIQTQLQIHTLLASLYLERGRFADAIRELDEDVRIDPRRAAFQRLKGLVLQAMSRPAEAADAFWATWLLDAADPQNAYRLIAYRSSQTTPQDVERALERLANVERELTSGERSRANTPFVDVHGIVDDAGGAMAFVPAAYALGFSLMLRGELDSGLAELRAAVAKDPLMTDSASRSEPLARGIAALRQGLVPAAIEQLEAAVARESDSSEAHRILGTAYLIQGDITRSVQHLRDAVRLNPRDERSWVALARTLDESGRVADAEDVLRGAVTELPEAGALRWRLSTTLEKRQRADQVDLTLIAMADRLVMLVGRGELYRALARLAQLNLRYDTAVDLLEHAVAITPNNAAAHQTLGRAYVENGRDTEGYAELVVALMLDPEAVPTLIDLGRWHLTAGQPARAVDVLERAVIGDRTNALAIRALADALIRAGRTAEGKQRLEESEQLQARAIDNERRVRSVAVLTFQAEVRMGARDFNGAIDLWRQAIALQRGSAARQLRLADALVAANRQNEAVTEYLTAISLGAGAEAHRRLAELYDTLGRADDSARERATYVSRRLQELRERADEGAPAR
jgi:tetratricopeptide (TPR) repeat protein